MALRCGEILRRECSSVVKKLLHLARLPKSKAKADEVDVVRCQIMKDVASLRYRHAIDRTGPRAVAATARSIREALVKLVSSTCVFLVVGASCRW